MKISDSFKQAINNAFKNSVFVGRSKEIVLSTLNSKVYRSNNLQIIPHIEDIDLERADEQHDSIIFIYEDYTFNGIITWRPSQNGQNSVFVKID